jgi:uncharacterized protein YmfQ (DUF2313 family)
MPERYGDPAAIDLTWEDMHDGAMNLLPTGAVWPRDPEGVLSRLVDGLTGNHWRAWERVKQMLEESDPRTSYETLFMWETDCGLPDPCIEYPPVSLEGRRAAVVAKRQEGSTTTPQDFVDYAARLGEPIEVTEFRPFRVWSRCDSYLNTEKAGWPHVWMVRIVSPTGSLHLFRANSLCTNFLAEYSIGQIECAFTRIMPAHTEIVFAYGPRTRVSDWDLGQSIWDNGNSPWDREVLP